MTNYVTFVDAPGRPRLRVEIPQDLSRGLQHRPWLHPDHGMLFPGVRTLWMRDTLIPLDMIFVGPDGQITEILEDVPPLSDELRESPGPVSFAIEVNAGWCRRHGVVPGQRVLV